MQSHNLGTSSGQCWCLHSHNCCSRKKGESERRRTRAACSISLRGSSAVSFPGCQGVEDTLRTPKEGRRRQCVVGREGPVRSSGRCWLPPGTCSTSGLPSTLTKLTKLTWLTMLTGVRQSGRQLEEGPGLGDRFTLISLVFISILNLNDFPFHPNGMHLPPGWSLSNLLKALVSLDKRCRPAFQSQSSEAKYNLFPKLSIYRVSGIESQ